MLMKTTALLATIAAPIMAPVAVLAQEAYPDGTLEVVTHSGAGGGTDTWCENGSGANVTDMVTYQMRRHDLATQTTRTPVN